MRQLPRVITFQVSCPLQELLQLSLFPMTSVVLDGLNFVVFFSSDKIRWRSREVWAMRFSLVIGR